MKSRQNALCCVRIMVLRAGAYLHYSPLPLKSRVDLQVLTAQLLLIKKDSEITTIHKLYHLNENVDFFFL